MLPWLQFRLCNDLTQRTDILITDEERQIAIINNYNYNYTSSDVVVLLHISISSCVGRGRLSSSMYKESDALRTSTVAKINNK